MRIDAHQHYWQPDRGDYGWLSQAPAALQRDFGPTDLQPLLDERGIDATVLVQAAPTVAETDFLLSIAERTASVAGVVGWIDFENPDERRTLDRLAAHPHMLGVRPMVQDIADDDWVLGANVRWAFDALQETGLAFDALGFARHASRFLKICERHPDLRVVLDHGLKPAIAQGAFERWASDIRALAQHTGALCKLSGLATEAAPGLWPEALRDALQPYVEHLLDVFGPERLIWGSDWPVCTLATSYGQWFDACHHWLAPLPEADRQRVFGGNALAVYRIDADALRQRLGGGVTLPKT